MEIKRRDLLKIIVSTAIGLPFAELLSAQPDLKTNKILHVFYHHIGSFKGKYWRNVSDFENDIRLLRRSGFESISCSDYLLYRNGRKTIPRKSVIISFDDGYANVVDNGMPVLRKYGYKACFFIVAGWVSSSRKKGIVSWKDLNNILKEGHDIQCHTWSHPNLKTLADDQKKWDLEIGYSKEILERETGKAIRFFAYPYGSHNDFIIDKVEQYSFEAAFTTKPGLSYSDSSIYRLKRDQPGVKIEMDEILYKYQDQFGYRIKPKPRVVKEAEKPKKNKVINSKSRENDFSDRINMNDVLRQILK
ncbi:MAG: polysaccharide deacetylase family protein [Candidatus Coatesbacteria bacterium]|nr:polysaccharide deacetylase family protein [Candidatus Coatesbacteria bacterium]